MSNKIRKPFQKGEMIRAKRDHSWVQRVFLPPDGDSVSIGDQFTSSIVLVRDWERVPRKSTPTARALRLADEVRSSNSHELNEIKIVDAIRAERNIANRHARAIIEKTTAERDRLTAELSVKSADFAKGAQPDLESGRLREYLERVDATIVAMSESVAAVMRERDAALVESARMNADRDRVEALGDKIIRERDELAAKLTTADNKRAELDSELTDAYLRYLTC